MRQVLQPKLSFFLRKTPKSVNKSPPEEMETLGIGPRIPTQPIKVLLLEGTARSQLYLPAPAPLPRPERTALLRAPTKDILQPLALGHQVLHLVSCLQREAQREQG